MTDQIGKTQATVDVVSAQPDRPTQPVQSRSQGPALSDLLSAAHQAVSKAASAVDRLQQSIDSGDAIRLSENLRKKVNKAENSEKNTQNQSDSDGKNKNTALEVKPKISIKA